LKKSSSKKSAPVPVEEIVRDREGKSYSLRLRPYRTRDNVIDGVVVALVDMNGPKIEAENKK
jgi:two-component system CheB/CheR fusion protein